MSITAFLQHVFFLSWRAVKISSEIQIIGIRQPLHLEKTQQGKLHGNRSTRQSSGMHILLNHFVIILAGLMPRRILLYNFCWRSFRHILFLTISDSGVYLPREATAGDYYYRGGCHADATALVGACRIAYRIYRYAA